MSRTSDPSGRLYPGLPRSFAEFGMICGFAFDPGAAARPIDPSMLGEALAAARTVVWLHLNASHSGVRRWLGECGAVPGAALDVLDQHEARHRIEPMGEGLLVVINDLRFEEQGEPGEVATLWAWVTPRLCLTARLHPLHTTDRLRTEARRGLQLASGIEVLAVLLEFQAEAIGTLLERVGDQVDHVEDQILRGVVQHQRDDLGRVRRLCTHLRRYFRPQRAALQKLAARPPQWIAEAQLDRLRSVAEDLGYLIDEAEHQQERAKILQEELTSRDTEATGRNLYVLTIYTVVLMPMTLISGIFGMNVAGLPGLHEPASFWWVMAGIVLAGAVTLGALVRRNRR
jgi:zinc transporter